MSEIEVHTITKPVWDMTGGEKRKFAQKDHPEFLIDIIKKSDHDLAIRKLSDKIEQLERQLKEATEVISEFIAIYEDVRTDEIDSFSLQPARLLMAELDGK